MFNLDILLAVESIKSCIHTYLFLILSFLLHISVPLPKVHPRYDLDGDASMAKVSIVFCVPWENI